MGRKYIFTNKKESKKGIMSAVLGIIALVSLFFAVYETFRIRAGAGKIRSGCFIRAAFCVGRNRIGYHV